MVKHRSRTPHTEDNTPCFMVHSNKTVGAGYFHIKYIFGLLKELWSVAALSQGCLQSLCCLWYSVHRWWEKLLYFKVFRSTWAPRLCGGKKNAFEECQACLKYLLLLLEDGAEKTPFMWRQRFQPKATFCHPFASWWSLSAYPALFFSVLFSLFFSSSPPSVFFSVSADWQIEVEVSPSPPGPAAHCDISPPPPPSSRHASLLIRQGYLGGPSPSKKPSTVTQKWTPPAVRGG